MADSRPPPHVLLHILKLTRKEAPLIGAACLNVVVEQPLHFLLISRNYKFDLERDYILKKPRNTAFQ